MFILSDNILSLTFFFIIFTKLFVIITRQELVTHYLISNNSLITQMYEIIIMNQINS